MSVRALLTLVSVTFFALLLTYGTSFTNSFHYDDAHSIVENPHIRTVRNIPAYFHTPEMFSGMEERAMYRPVVVTTLALNYWLGGYQVWGYHVVNFLIHCSATAAVYAVGTCLSLSLTGAAIAAILFAFHPVQSEAVNYISSRSESLAALAYMASLAFHLCWRSRGVVPLYGASLLSFVVALLSKSTAITLPAVLLCIFLLDRKSTREHFHRGLIWQAPYWLLAAGYVLIVRGIALSAFADPVRPWADQIYTQLKAVPYYLQVVIMPVSLSVEHQFSVTDQMYSATVIASLFFVLSLGFIVFAALCGSARWRVPGLLLLCAFITMLPASVVPLNVLVNDHRLYLPMALIGLAFCGLWWSRFDSMSANFLHGAGKWMLFSFAFISILIIGVRNTTWRDGLSLWQDAVNKAPMMYRSHMHLGGAQEEAGQIDLALVSYKRAVELAPEIAEAHYNHANGLRLYGRINDAREVYKNSLHVNPDYRPSLVNLANLELDAGRPQMAEKHLVRALENAPNVASLRRFLGVAYRNQRRYEEAANMFQQAIALDPGKLEVYYNLANLRFDQGRLEDASKLYRHVLQHNSADLRAAYNLCDTAVRLGQFHEAIQVCKEGLRLSPGQGNFYYPLAQAQEGLGRFRDAANSYRNLLQADIPSALRSRVMKKLDRYKGAGD